MNKVIDSAVLSQAFELYENKRADEYAGSECFEPSKKFDKKIRKLIKSRTNIYHRVTLTKARKVMLAAAIIAAIMAASLSVDAIREKIFSFFVTGNEDYNIIEHLPDRETYPFRIDRVFAPSYIPEGYSLKESSNDENSAYLCYTKGDDYLTVEQFVVSDYYSASDIEFQTYTWEDYEGINFIIKTDDDMTMLIWERDGYVFEAVGYVGVDEMLKTAASVE